MEYFKNCMTQEQLEQEHRKMVIKMHPDRNPDNPNATAEFQEMQSITKFNRCMWTIEKDTSNWTP